MTDIDTAPETGGVPAPVDPDAPETTTPHESLLHWVFAGTGHHVVGLVARLGLADTLGAAELDAGTLAARHGLEPDLTERLMRATAALGLTTETAPGRYALTPSGRLLRSDVDGTLVHLVRLHAEAWVHLTSLEMEHHLRTGETAFARAHGVPIFEYIGTHPEVATTFNAAMGESTRAAARLVAERIDLSRFGSVTDVGGNDATLLCEILDRYPAMHGVVFDLPEGTRGAAENLAARGLANRCRIVHGDFFTEVPAGADAHVMKSVLHDWDDDRAVQILRRCREALGPGGRVLMVEMLLPEVVEPQGPAVPYLSDLDMLLICDGKERTRSQFDALCVRAGLGISAVTELGTHDRLAVIEAAPVG